MDLETEEPMFNVVINIEEQYSIWPIEKEIPVGWTYAGVKGTKTQCLAYIEAVWTDMRPLSLRKLMGEQGKK
jgi:MbtH protein